MMVNKEFEDYLLMRVHENDDSRCDGLFIDEWG